MPQNKTDLIIRLRAEQERLRKDLRRATDHMTRFQKRSNQIGSAIQKNFMFAFGGAAILSGIRNITEAYDKQEKALAQVRQGLETTGGVAGKTFDELTRLATNLQKKTLFGDEEILQGATAQLLTFTNIAEDNFDRVQAAVLDVSTRVGQDLKSTAIQLGKALNDPIANLGALSRTGIQFSEDQKKVIKSLAETNRLSEAQALILEELEKQYGGSAEAAAKAGTGGWKQLGNALGDLNEQIGKLLVGSEGSNSLANWLRSITEELTNLLTVLNNGQISTFFKNLVAYANPFSAVGASVSSSVASGFTGSQQPNGGASSPNTGSGSGSGGGSGPFFSTNNQSFWGFTNGYIETVRKFTEDLEEIEPQVQTQIESMTNVFSTGLAGLREVFYDNGVMLKEIFVDLNNTIAGGLTAALSGLESGGLSGMFKNLLSFIGGNLQKLGIGLVAYSKALEGFRYAIANPAIGIAAGLSAIAAGTLIKGYASNLSNIGKGGGGFSGGGFQSIGRQSQGAIIAETRVSGSDLDIILKRAQSNNSRTTG